MPASTPAWRHPLVVVSLALTACVYWPITQVYFFADDFVHFADIENNGALHFLLSPFGGHAFPVRNLIFLGTYWTVGLREDLYFWVVLLTHLLNVGLLFSMLRTITLSALLACFGATLWGISPLAVGTIGWYSAYGHALTATILLVVFGSMVRRAATGEPLSTRLAWWWFALLLAGTTCYGTGLGLALGFPVTLFLVLPDAWRRPGLRNVFVTLPLVAGTVYVGLRTLYTLWEPVAEGDAWYRSLALSHLAAVPAMFVHLLGFATAGTLLGFRLTGAGYPNAASVVAVVTLAAGIAFVVWRGDTLARRSLLGVLASSAAIYLLIAIGRAGVYLEYFIPPWQAAAVPRHHYAGTLGIVAALCLMLRELGRLPLVRAVPGTVLLAAGMELLGTTWLRSEFKIDDHYPVREYVAETLHTFGTAAAAEPVGATVYLENEVSPAFLLGPVLPNHLFPGRAGLFLITHSSDAFDGRRFRFVERDPETLAKFQARRGTRMAELLVAPYEVP